MNIAELKAKAVVEGVATLHVNGNEYRATDVRGKVFVSFNGARIAADKAQTTLDFDNAAVERVHGDTLKASFPAAPVEPVRVNVALPFGKISVRVVNVAARRLREELASLRVKHGYKVVSDENGLRYEAKRLVKPAVVKRIAKLKRLLDMANGRKPVDVWVYVIENGGRHYGFSDNWQRKPKFHGWEL